MREVQVQPDTSALISTSASAPAALRPPPVWHAIRPWTPHWTLAVREITSVSATFILSSTLDARAATVTDGTESGLARDRELASSTIPSATSPAVSVLDSHRPILADTDLSVVVNDSTWQRFIMRMHESADEAIVLIHGLHPGRQYDIDIAIGGGMVGRRMVVTNEDVDGTDVEGENSGENGLVTLETTTAVAAATTATDLMAVETPPIVGALPIQESSSSFSISSPSTTPSTAASHSLPPSPTLSHSTIVQTHEDRLGALTSRLSALNEEQVTLQSSLKSARRDAQKTSTGLRNEIDVLRRASEKAVVAEGKARQRVRALEDAVKRASEGREEVERETERNERAMPALREREATAEEELKRIRGEADAVRAEKERRDEDVRKRKESTKAECANVTQKFERLGMKKERLERSVIPDLEAQLAEIERKIELAERGRKENAIGESAGRSQQRRQSHAGTIGWPGPNAAQRPPGQLPSSQVNPVIQASRHQPRSQSMYRQGTDGPPPGLGATAFAHTPSGSLSHSTAPVNSGMSHSVFNLALPSASSLSRSTNSTVSSFLSSKAAPFEPTRSFRPAFPLSNPTPNTPSGSFSVGSGQGAFGPSSSVIRSPLPSSTSNSGTTFLSSPASPAFSGNQSGPGTLPPPIQRPTHVSNSSSGSVATSASVTAQLMRLGRPAMSKVANGSSESGTRTTSGG